MRRLFTTLCCLSLAAPLLGAEPSPSAAAPRSFGEALKRGRAGFEFRYRFENVSDDAVPEGEAHASTLRAAPRWESAPYKGLSFHLEAEIVAAIGDDLYNNLGAGGLGNGVRDRPVVADPALTELNQAYARFARSGSRLQVGRQEILRGDQRFVGNVGWRQNHQSFDALTFAHAADRWRLHYAYVDAVHRIFGDRQEMASHLLDAVIETGPAGALTLYGLLLDYDDRRDRTLSTATLGLELAGSREVAEGRQLLWELEYADQRDAGDNPRRIAADYLHGMVGGEAAGVAVRLGWERLEGSPAGGSFRTPLATLHKFNGWADKFLATPPAGLEDLYLSVGGSLSGVRWTAVAHDFGAESASSDYGRELDLQLLYTTPWKQTLALKLALYDAEEFGADTEKVMLWTTYAF